MGLPEICGYSVILVFFLFFASFEVVGKTITRGVCYRLSQSIRLGVFGRPP